MSAATTIVLVGLLAGLATAALGAAVIRLSRHQLVRAASGRLGVVAEATDDALGVPGAFGRVLVWLAPDADPERAFTGVVLGAAVVVGAAALVAPEVVAVLGLMASSAAMVVRRSRDRPTSSAEYEAGLVSCLAELEASLASGASLHQSVAVTARRSGPAAADFAEVHRAVRDGQPMQGALDRWAVDRPDGGVPMVADALAIAGSTGASQSVAVQAVIATLRRRRAHRQEVRALASQARASAVVLVALPVAFAVAISLLDPRVGRFLFASPPGWACLLGGLGLDAAGAWWMALLVKRVR